MLGRSLTIIFLAYAMLGEAEDWCAFSKLKAMLELKFVTSFHCFLYSSNEKNITFMAARYIAQYGYPRCHAAELLPQSHEVFNKP